MPLTKNDVRCIHDKWIGADGFEYRNWVMLSRLFELKKELEKQFMNKLKWQDVRECPFFEGRIDWEEIEEIINSVFPEEVLK